MHTWFHVQLDQKILDGLYWSSHKHPVFVDCARFEPAWVLNYPRAIEQTLTESSRHDTGFDTYRSNYGEIMVSKK